MSELLKLAYQIIDLHTENKRLRLENEELRQYKQRFHDEVRASISHSHKMMGGLMTLIMTPGVSEALARGNPKVSESQPIIILGHDDAN